jgi:predicted Rossmann-fold nucleotide-binding protein
MGRPFNHCRIWKCSRSRGADRQEGAWYDEARKFGRLASEKGAR